MDQSEQQKATIKSCFQQQQKIDANLKKKKKFEMFMQRGEPMNQMIQTAATFSVSRLQIID